MTYIHIQCILYVHAHLVAMGNVLYLNTFIWWYVYVYYWLCLLVVFPNHWPGEMMCVFLSTLDHIHVPELQHVTASRIRLGSHQVTWCQRIARTAFLHIRVRVPPASAQPSSLYYSPLCVGPHTVPGTKHIPRDHHVIAITQYRGPSTRKLCCFKPPLCILFRTKLDQASAWNMPWVGSNQRPSDQKCSTLPLDYCARRVVYTGTLRQDVCSAWVDDWSRDWTETLSRGANALKWCVQITRWSRWTG